MYEVFNDFDSVDYDDDNDRYVVKFRNETGFKVLELWVKDGVAKFVSALNPPSYGWFGHARAYRRAHMFCGAYDLKDGNSFIKYEAQDMGIPAPVEMKFGVTVRQLKEFVKDLPEVDEHTGDEYEVWIGRDGLSNACKSIWPLNSNGRGCDVFLGYGEE